MPKHIGIVACSAEGAALCYTNICTIAPEEMGRKHAHPEVSMHTHPFSDYVRLMEAGNWHGVAALMLSSEAKLAKAGHTYDSYIESGNLCVYVARLPECRRREATVSQCLPLVGFFSL